MSEASARRTAAESAGRVTTVVVTRNCWPDLRHSLPRREGPVILVDNGSTDGTPDLVRRHHPDVDVVDLRENHGVAARNIGVRRARTPYVAFADGDSWWEPGALGEAAQVLDAHPRLAVLAARMLTGEGDDADPVREPMTDSPLGAAADLPGPAVPGFPACGVVVRRSACVLAGGFDERLSSLAEEKLALDLAAAGWGLAYVDRVVAYRRPSAVPEARRRRVREERDRILTALMRRPWPVVAQTLAAGIRDRGVGPRAVAAALPELPHALARRQVLTEHAERACVRLDDRGEQGGGAEDGDVAEERSSPVARPLQHGRTETRTGTRDGRVSVVMITHQRRAEADVALRRLQALPERPEVVVVDNGSTDGTAEMVRTRHPDVVLLRPRTNLGAVGRNLGVAVSETPYVAFCDDDTRYEPGALSAAADLLDAHPTLAVVTASIVVEPRGRLDAICEEMAQSPLPRPPGLPGHPLLSFLAGVSVVRRSAFEEVGGFHDRIWLGGEEELLAADLARAGWHMAYVPEIAAHHRASALRDPHLRRRHGIRNTLWFAWLRRPLPSALRRTGQLLTRVPRDRITALGIAEAVRGLPWVLSERRVVPRDVEAGYRLLDDMQLSGGTRKYVS